MHYLSIGAIFRTENSWLEEWICYHRIIGVEHFFLFNDDEDTHVSDRILRPFVESGIVENIHVKDLTCVDVTNPRGRQNAVYKEIISMARNRTFWLGMIDIDEFILPRRTDDLRAFMRDFEEFNGLAINWTNFGTNGHILRPPTQIDHLPRRADQSWDANSYVKSIVKPDKVSLDRLYDVHDFPGEDGVTVNENHEPVRWMRHEISTEKIRINHYLLRSLQDFWEVKAVRQRFNMAPPCDEVYFERHDRNEIYDDEISRRFGKTVEAARIDDLRNAGPMQ